MAHPKGIPWERVVVAVILLLTLVGLALFFFMYAQEKSPAVPIADRSLLELTIDDRTLTVEVVNTPASITQGLSGRSEIGSDGMLFVLGEKRIPQFWMKEMQFGLDLVWIREGRIVSITPHVPHPSPDVLLSDLPFYLPPEAVDMVLEIPAGRAAEWSLKPGATVGFPSGSR